MRFSRVVIVLASLGLAGTQAFAARTVGFANTVSYSSGVVGANAVVAADVNGDGFPDLVVGTNNGVSLLLNNGDGTFAPATTFATNGTFTNAVAVTDVNNDGIPDIIVTNECLDPSTCSGVTVLLGNGDGTFQSAVGYNSGGLETGGVVATDINGDGFPDLVLVSNCELQTCANGTLTLLLNKADGTGTFATKPLVLLDGRGPVAVADVNGDNIPDLVTAAGAMLGVGNGTFGQPIVPLVGGSVSIALADVNGDGKLDAVSVIPKGVAVQLGNGDGTFQSPIIFKTGGLFPMSVTVADFNGDGKLDLAVANQCSVLTNGVCTGIGTIGVLAGNGDGTFSAVVVFKAGGTIATSVVAADLDQDGKTDLVASNACISATSCANGVVGTLTNNFIAAVAVQLISSLNPAILGQSVTFTATLTSAPPVPDGSPVTFTDGTNVLGTSTTVGGVATWTTSFSVKGGHTIRATYNGDQYHKSALRALSEMVNPYPSTTTVTTSPNPSTFGQSVTITATVSSSGGPTPTGTVTFKSGTLALATVSLSSGAATLSTTKLPAGSDTITAIYHGDTQTATSTGTTTQQVN